MSASRPVILITGAAARWLAGRRLRELIPVLRYPTLESGIGTL